MKIELEFTITIDGSSITYGRQLENGGPCLEFGADVQMLRCTLSDLMKAYITEHCS